MSDSGFDRLSCVSRPQSIFEQLSAVLNSALPVDIADDVKKNLKAALRGACDRLDLVTHEELAVQEAVLQRTRAKVESLEKEVAALEARLETD